MDLFTFKLNGQHFICTCVQFSNFLIVERSLKILNVSLNDNKDDIATVSWSAANMNDIEIIYLSILSDTKKEIRTVDKQTGEVSGGTSLEPGEYNLTLCAVDICGEVCSSPPFPLPPITEPQLSTLGLCPTPLIPLPTPSIPLQTPVATSMGDVKESGTSNGKTLHSLYCAKFICATLKVFLLGCHMESLLKLL